MNSIILEIKICFFLKLGEIYYFFTLKDPLFGNMEEDFLLHLLDLKKKKKLHLCIEKNGKQEDRLERIT